MGMFGAVDWDKAYQPLMEIARQNLDPQWEHGEAAVLRTSKGRTFVTRIPDCQNTEARESLENQCIQQLTDAEDTEVVFCLATIDGIHPEILSWNFRSRLLELNPNNHKTQLFLWGGGEVILRKPLGKLL